MIGLIDYGLGNLNSFANILNSFDEKFFIISNKNDFNRATKIILPGVGAFDKAINLLNFKNFTDALNKKVLIEKVPTLGVCVGMQIMAKTSQEGSEIGLGWTDDKVECFDKNSNFPIPHMGWNKVVLDNSIDIFKDISELKFYFLHSYYFSSNTNIKNIATTSYGVNFVSAFNKENIYGIQFHPEKSHLSGVKLLKNFCNLK